MNVYIKLNNTTGIDADNFSFFSDYDGYTAVLQTGISRSQLVNVGYTLTNVPNDANNIKVQSNTVSCTTFEIVPVTGKP